MTVSEVFDEENMELETLNLREEEMNKLAETKDQDGTEKQANSSSKLAQQEALLDAHRTKTHCKLNLFIDHEMSEKNNLRLVPRNKLDNVVLNEANFTKITDIVERMELEFNYNDEEYIVDPLEPQSILELVRKNGDVGPDARHYDLNEIEIFRKLPKFWRVND